LSVAVTTDGSGNGMLDGQATVMFETLATGRVLSTLVIVCILLVELPLQSVAVQVRVMVELLAQLPGTDISL
jgi:hypothetical protein